MNTFKLMFFGLVMAVLIIAASGCSNRLSTLYYARHPMSSQEVSKVWGAPVAVVPIEDGIEKRIYEIQNPATDLKYRYFLVKDGQVVASGITDQSGRPASQKDFDKTSFVPSDLSKAYYQKHSVTVSDLDRVWGEPLRVDSAKGMQLRVYEISNPLTDFRYRMFLVKDDRVFASRISPEKGFARGTQDRVPRSIQISELSNAYYKKHPMSLGEVEKVWGHPITIEKEDAGLEKRMYKMSNPLYGFEFRYFVVKEGQVVSSGITDTIDVTR